MLDLRAQTGELEDLYWNHPASNVKLMTDNTKIFLCEGEEMELFIYNICQFLTVS